ncbi:MAG: amidinotransferase [Chitinophagales bacterium]|nr:amidinotransferase [Chitinophagales bacterium]
MKESIASHLLMIRPSAFSYNKQTALSNSFQENIKPKTGSIADLAIAEFDKAVEILIGKNLLVGVLEDDLALPDAVFPNNWFVTTNDCLVLCPMESELRRRERNPNIIATILNNFKVAEVIDLSAFESEGQFLEGTGSMVFDRSNKCVFSSVSSRTDQKLLQEFSKLIDHECLMFETVDRYGNPVYHTNVMMSIGNEVAVVCFDAIKLGTDKVRDRLKSFSKQIISISMDQMENFCGNILQVKNERNKFWLMSERAYKNFNPAQLDLISESGEIISIPLNVIEKCGGGSIRCMIAEIFLQPQ